MSSNCVTSTATGTGRFYHRALDQQWGDDWNDAPFEHNAEPPYEWEDWRNMVPYQIQSVYFDSDLETPASGVCNSPWSVQQINAGQVAWLRDGFKPERFIMAGTTLQEFKRKIAEWGGTVYVKEV